MLKKFAKASISTAALITAQGALAQTDDSASRPRGNDEIVVTATKVETSLQETPIAITAVTSETLAQRGLTTTADLGKIVPNADFQKAQGIYGPAVTVFLLTIPEASLAVTGRDPADDAGGR